MKELNKLISSSEMDQSHNSSPPGSDISVDTTNEDIEVRMYVHMNIRTYIQLNLYNYKFVFIRICQTMSRQCLITRCYFKP